MYSTYLVKTEKVKKYKQNISHSHFLSLYSVDMLPILVLIFVRLYTADILNLYFVVFLGSYRYRYYIRIPRVGILTLPTYVLIRVPISSPYLSFAHRKCCQS